DDHASGSLRLYRVWKPVRQVLNLPAAFRSRRAASARRDGREDQPHVSPAVARTGLIDPDARGGGVIAEKLQEGPPALPSPRERRCADGVERADRYCGMVTVEPL